MQVAVSAAVIAFFLGLVALLVREFLSWYFERLKTKEKLVNLFDLYLVEVIDGSERCEQYIRQAATNSMSRSRLSLLLGSGKFDKAVEMGASPHALQALFTIYRLFDLVQNQIQKYKHEEFVAIAAFIQDDCNKFFDAVQVIRRYVRDLHADLDNKKCRRLLLKVAVAISVVRTEYLWGVGKEPYLSPLSLDDLDKRADMAEKECKEWVVALQDVEGFMRPSDQIGQAYVTKMLARTPKDRGKFLRALAHEIMGMAAIEMIDGKLRRRRKDDCVDLGNRIAEAPTPTRGYRTANEKVAIMLAQWEEFWKKHDPQSWEL